MNHINYTAVNFYYNSIISTQYSNFIQYLGYMRGLMSHTLFCRKKYQFPQYPNNKDFCSPHTRLRMPEVSEKYVTGI